LSHLESTRKDINAPLVPFKKKCGCLANPITIQEVHGLEQFFNACCVLHNIILDYNVAYNWKAPVSHGVGSCDVEAEDEIPVIEKDFSHICAHHRNDEEWIIMQDIKNPSPDLRAPARYFVNDDVTKVEMMVRLNKLQSHFVYVVASKNIGKLKRMRHINTGHT
jgi:hypothetical protein